MTAAPALSVHVLLALTAFAFIGAVLLGAF
jgi:hypothetical protein